MIGDVYKRQVVKLTRVVLLAPLVLVLRFFYKSEDTNSNSNLVSTILKFLPWFVIGFLLLAILRSTEVISNDFGLDIRSTAKFLFIISMVAIGLSVDLKEMIKVGPKVVITILTIIAFMILLGVFSSGFIN